MRWENESTPLQQESVWNGHQSLWYAWDSAPIIYNLHHYLHRLLYILYIEEQECVSLLFLKCIVLFSFTPFVFPLHCSELGQSIVTIEVDMLSCSPCITIDSHMYKWHTSYALAPQSLLTQWNTRLVPLLYNIVHSLWSSVILLAQPVTYP